MKLNGVVKNSPCLENRTAAERFNFLSRDKSERAVGGAFNQNVTTGLRSKSSLELLSVWSDDRCFVGWVSAAEAEALSLTEARHG
jgi:hypothetical protein